MRFPSRQLLVAGSVLGALSASGTTAANLTVAALSTPEVALPSFGTGTAHAAAVTAVPTPVVTPTAPITGEQIAALALAPAQDKAAAIVQAQQQAEAERMAAEQRAAAARQAPATQVDRDREQMREDLRRGIREACSRGYLEGPICQVG